MSKKISQLPPFIGTLPTDAKIPVSIGTTTYRTTPADLAAASAPTLAQTLTQGGRALDETIISDYTIQASDRSKFREILAGDSVITITLDDTTWTPADKIEGATFIFRNANNFDDPFKVILTKNPLTAWIVAGYEPINEIEIPAGCIVEITYSQLGAAVVLHSAKVDSYFEVQITQTGTSAPDIVPGSIIGAKGATITTSHESTGYVRITSDLPIFANAKDYTRSSDNRQTFFTSNSGASFLSFYNILVEDDYNIGIEMYYLNAGTPIPADGIFTTPVLIRIPFKQ